jgi:hypothetical protein
MSDSTETIWTRGRMRSARAVSGGGRRPIVSYQAVLLHLGSHGPMPTARLARELGVPERRMKGRLVALWEYGFVQSWGDQATQWRLSMEGLRLVQALRVETLTPGRGTFQPGGGVA